MGYFPGAKPIHLKLLYRPSDGRVLGAQAIGEEGVDKRIDVLATAIQMKATVEDLSGAELCYAPQFGTRTHTPDVNCDAQERPRIR